MIKFLIKKNITKIIRLREIYSTFKLRFQSKLLKLYLQYATDFIDGSILDRTITFAISFVKYDKIFRVFN